VLAAGTVERIDSATNQAAGEPTWVPADAAAIAVADRALWVARVGPGDLSEAGEDAVTRIDLATGTVVADIPVPSEPHRVAYGAGAAWVGNYHDDSVSRIDPASNRVVGSPIPIGFPAGNLAVGAGGVWVTSDYRVDADPEDVVVVRIDPQANRAVETMPGMYGLGC
jgi:DNA-binding beta-propeller fold protein YncE